MGAGTPERLLTVRVVCELLDVSKQTVYRLVNSGELKPTRIGQRLRFEASEVASLIERGRERT
jgi:excisionase family DNA binding protein